MRNLIKSLLVACLLFTATSVFAQDAEEQEETKKWEGVGEFGFVNTTGNTESTALNMNLSFTYNMEKWRHRFLATALMTSEDGVQDNERYTAEIQSERALNEKSWIFYVSAIVCALSGQLKAHVQKVKTEEHAFFPIIQSVRAFLLICYAIICYFNSEMFLWFILTHLLFEVVIYYRPERSQI